MKNATIKFWVAAAAAAEYGILDRLLNEGTVLKELKKKPQKIIQNA